MAKEKALSQAPIKPACDGSGTVRRASSEGLMSQESSYGDIGPSIKQSLPGKTPHREVLNEMAKEGGVVRAESSLLLVSIKQVPSSSLYFAMNSLLLVSLFHRVWEFHLHLFAGCCYI